MAERVRYLDRDQSDGNVARQTLHPLWQATQRLLRKRIADRPSPLTPEDIGLMEVWRKRELYQANILGNIAGWAVTYDLDNHAIERNLPEMIRHMVARAVEPESRFYHSVDRQRQKHVIGR